MSETIKYATEDASPKNASAPQAKTYAKGLVPSTTVYDWLLNHYGFKPFEVERRRFLDRHHHLINPRFYTPHARASLDQLLARHAMAAEFMRVAKRPA